MGQGRQREVDARLSGLVGSLGVNQVHLEL